MLTIMEAEIDKITAPFSLHMINIGASFFQIDCFSCSFSVTHYIIQINLHRIDRFDFPLFALQASKHWCTTSDSWSSKTSITTPNLSFVDYNYKKNRAEYPASSRCVISIIIIKSISSSRQSWTISPLFEMAHTSVASTDRSNFHDLIFLSSHSWRSEK